MAASLPATRLGRIRLRLTGLAFLLGIVGLVGLAIALYQKAFTPVVAVTLRTDRIGNQLSAPADVKLRGLIVGTVRGVSSAGDGARVELALDPATVGLIPKNVTARLLPKTLFGEKFVSLVPPAAPSPARIGAGDEIPQDRSSTSIETEKVLDDLMPLLRSLRPAQLSITLNALSGTLRGRGNKIGANLELVDSYFSRLNPELPGIQRNVRGIADLAANYDAAAPDLLAVLDNLSFSSRSLVDQRSQLDTFLRSTTTSTDTVDAVLRENETRLVSLARDSLPSLQVFAKYSPEFPCLLKGLNDYQPVIERAFGGAQPGLHITLEITRDNGGYVGPDRPQYLEDRAPSCMGLPRPPVPQGDAEFRDGYRDAQRGGLRASSTSPATVIADPARALAGPAAQRDAVAAVAAPVLGVRPDAVPDLVQLLFGPVARGTTVGLS